MQSRATETHYLYHMLEITNLSFAFGSYAVLQNLSLGLPKGNIGTLLGPSGSGKTTLFRLLTGLLPTTNSTINIASQSPPQAYQHVAYMTQDDLLLPWRNVIDNLMLVGELGQRLYNMKSLRAEARHYLREMGLESWEEAYPHQLSGGMRQRVSLARSLLQKRPLLLLDEPFTSLDVHLREQMHELLHTIRQKHGITILLITHDFRDALSVSDQIFLLRNKTIAQEWTITPEARRDPSIMQELTASLYSP